MPTYLFKHPETEEVIEIIQSVKDKHEYVDDKGVTWDRVWTVPNAAIDSENDGSEEGFMKYTQNKCGTMGDIWDASREASEKRIQKYGEDKVQNSNYEKYSKKRRGMKHTLDR